jgi:flagellar biosynthesis/type III secretory pathway protein FliH
MQSAVDRWEAEVKAAEEAARAPPPEIVAKALLDASWEEGRLQGFADGINDGLAQAAASLEAAATLALEGTAATLLETVEEARRDGALAAEGLMKSVLAVISATIPVLAKRVGEEEIKRFLDEIIPILADEPKIIIRVSPELVDKLTSRYPKGQINVVADDDIEIGDVRVDWRAGTAARDTQLQRKAALSALAMFGLSKSN